MRNGLRLYAVLRWMIAASVPAIGLAPAAGAARADDTIVTSGRGPIQLRNMRPYNLLFLQFMPESGDVLASGAGSLSFQWDAANNMLIPSPNQGATVVEDNEYERFLFSWRKGLGRQLELGVFVPILWRNGGFMDGLLSGWHSLWGFPGRGDDDVLGRDAYPKYRSILRVVDSSGNTRIDQGNAFGPGDVSVTLKSSLIRTTPRAALAARLGLKLPTGNPTVLLGSGNADVGLSLDARYSVGRDVILYLNAGGILMGKASHAPGAQSRMTEGMIGVEYRPNRRDSFHLQVDANSMALRTGNRFADQADVTATFGYKRVLDSCHILFAAFSENGDIHNYTLPGFSNVGPDFTTSIGIEWRR